MRSSRRKARPGKCTRPEADWRPPARPNSTVRMPKYIYQPLEKPGSEFRLLRISKHPLTDLPQCTLQKYSLTNCPKYTALSYTWGQPTPTHNVAVDGASLEIRSNLFDFLRYYITAPWGMSDTTRPVFYWIDQMCINQEDLIERSDQVRIMHKIYKQAKNVLVWLGCDSRMTEAARRLRDAVDDDVWAFAELPTHPYFSRIWIVQEIALSVNYPLIVCGGVKLSWDRFHFASQSAHLTIQPAAWATIFGRDLTGKRRTLEECIRLHRLSNCHDLRDKVYGLLGLTPERWRVRIDYTKEVLEVYFDAVAALYEELFDIKDPECLYPKHLTLTTDPGNYCHTLLFLGKAMGLPERSLPGLNTFLQYTQRAYLSTEIRNIHYTYTGPVYTRVRVQSSYGQLSAIEEEEIEVSWGSITATRRNPLMRDIIPEMGLQLTSTTMGGTTEQSGDSVPVRNRWWCKHDGEIHYFDCFDDGYDNGYDADSDADSDDGIERCFTEE